MHTPKQSVWVNSCTEIVVLFSSLFFFAFDCLNQCLQKLSFWNMQELSQWASCILVESFLIELPYKGKCDLFLWLMLKTSIHEDTSTSNYYCSRNKLHISSSISKMYFVSKSCSSDTSTSNSVDHVPQILILAIITVQKRAGHFPLRIENVFCALGLQGSVAVCT